MQGKTPKLFPGKGIFEPATRPLSCYTSSIDVSIIREAES